METEQELLTAIKAGDRQAMKRLYERYLGYAMSIGLRYIPNEEDAEDVVQDVLLRLWQMRDQLKMPIEPLAKVLTRNRCIDLIRRKKPSTELTIAVFQEEDEPLRERIERMMQVIETLPDLQQTILRLRHMEGMDSKEIAELTGVSINTSLGRMRYALINMRRMAKNNKIELTLQA